MSETTNNITTVFSADISNFSKSAQDLNRYISTVNAEFKNATAGMDDWSDSTDGLQAKLKQLDGTLSAQKAQLAQTAQAYKKLKDEGKENTREGQQLYIALQKQQAQVKNTEAAIKDYTDSLNNMDKSSEKADESTGKLTSGFGSLAKGAIAGAAAAVAGIVTSFLALAEGTRELRTEMAKLETAYTTAGLSAEAAEQTHTELFGVLGDSGKATEAAQQLAQIANNEAELTGLTHTLTGVYATFGESLPVEGLAEAMNHTAKVGAVQGNLADALEWSGVSVDDFNANLATMNTEEERSAYITETLNGLYGTAADKYKEVNADVIEANKAQATLNQTLADLGAVAEPIMTTIKTLVNELLVSITPFVELIGSGLKGALNGSAEAAGDLAAGVGGLLQTVIDRVVNMLPTVLNVILQLIPQIVSGILGQVPSLVSMVLDLATEIINTLSVLLPEIVNQVVDIIPKIITNIVNAVPQLLQAAIQFLMAIVQALPTIIDKLLTELPKIIDLILNTVINAVPQLIEAAIKLFMTLVEALPKIISALITALPKVINTIINAVVNSVPLLLDASIKLFMALINAVPKILPLLIGEIPKIITSIITALVQNIPKILKASLQLFGGILKAIPQIIIELVKSVPQIITSIVKSLGSGAKALASVGSDMLKGLWQGMSDVKNWVMDKISGLFNKTILAGIKKLLGINSPSKAFAQLGEYSGEGYIQGLQRSIKGANIGLNVSDFAGAAGIGSGGGSSVKNSTVNVYQSFTGVQPSRYALRQAKLETVNALKFAGGVT